MALSVRAKDVEAAARQLADRRGTSVTGALRLALTNELARDAHAEQADYEKFMAGIREIQERVAKIPDSGLTEDEIMGWDESGLPT